MNANFDSNKALIRAYVDAINKYNWDMLGDFISDEFVRHSYAAGEPKVNCCGDLIQFFRAQQKDFSKNLKNKF